MRLFNPMCGWFVQKPSSICISHAWTSLAGLHYPPFSKQKKIPNPLPFMTPPAPNYFRAFPCLSEIINEFSVWVLFGLNWKQHGIWTSTCTHNLFFLSIATQLPIMCVQCCHQSVNYFQQMWHDFRWYVIMGIWPNWANLSKPVLSVWITHLASCNASCCWIC